FFFQAEDGIRDGHVTGVQTCALPISADVGFKAQQRAHRGACDVDDLNPVQHAQGCRVGRVACQLFEVILGDLLDIHRFQVCRAELERSEEHTSELQSRGHLVCRLLLEKKKKQVLDELI